MQNLGKDGGEVQGVIIHDWMSPKEAAAYLGITLTTLTNWSKKGAIDKHKVIGKVYLRSADVYSLPSKKDRRDS
jgi:excisionase family DNA binding protein